MPARARYSETIEDAKRYENEMEAKYGLHVVEGQWQQKHWRKIGRRVSNQRTKVNPETKESPKRNTRGR